MRVLVTGGTGAMGMHVCNLLAERGYKVFVTSRRPRDDRDGIHYVLGDAKDRGFLDSLLCDGWDVIVDFMVWTTEEFRQRYEGLIDETNQYVFLSSYRVYADSPVITEESPRLLDVIDDPVYLATDEYALAKARCEDILMSSGRANWTVVRPAITYDGSVGRLQLTVMESSEWIWRASNRIPIPLPEQILTKQTTMSWGRDVAMMIAGLVGRDESLGECYTVSTADHMSWMEVAQVYREVVPLELVACDLGMFERIRGAAYQVRYDRMYDRIVDNSKVLNATGMTQQMLTPMREGLVRELRKYLKYKDVPILDASKNGRLDRLVGGMPSLKPLLKSGLKELPVATAKYMFRRYVG